MQGRGRARKADSSFVVMSERSDRSAEILSKVEKKQLEIIKTYRPSLNPEIDSKAMKHAQQARERSAADLLSNEKNVSNLTVISIINTYSQKTKVSVNETISQTKRLRTDDSVTFSGQGVGVWNCVLSYDSVLRNCSVSHSDVNAKIAKQGAYLKLWYALKRSIEEP